MLIPDIATLFRHFSSAIQGGIEGLWEKITGGLFSRLEPLYIRVTTRNISIKATRSKP